MVKGQLESSWPVHGTVLVDGDELFITAGRCSFVDGGILFCRLNPVTGELLSQRWIRHYDPNTKKQLGSEKSWAMDGTLNDILVTDGKHIFLKEMCLTKDGAVVEETKNHLFTSIGLLNDDQFVRSYWLYGSTLLNGGFGGWARASEQFASGRILSKGKDHIYGYGRVQPKSGVVGHKADSTHLFSMPIKQKPAGSGKKKLVYQWTKDLKIIVQAMAISRDKLFVAGTPRVSKKKSKIFAYVNPDESLEALQGQQGARLLVISKEDGSILSEYQLDTPPVFDGLSIAAGKVFIAVRDGSVICLGE
jgi:hypothetical protein